MYSRTYYSKEELEADLRDKVNPLDINRIISAYDMADMAYAEKLSVNGSPYFFHTSRVCRIIVNELKIYEPDLIIGALLHDVFEACTEISPEIINYNFGPYITYLLTILKDDYESINHTQIPLNVNNFEVKLPKDDYLIIWLAEHLDNFRSLDITPLFNPINYINQTVSVLFPIAEMSDNPIITKLLNELKQERNKILG